MDRLHARYPFLDGARTAVEAADVDLAELVTGGERAVIERARDRVETALSEGHVGTLHRSTRIELLSYPVARVLVSLLEEPMAVDAYARAEAKTARQRLREDLPEPGGRRELGESGDVLGVDELLAEFGLADTVEGRDPFRVEVGTYLDLAEDLEGEEWALVERSLSGGAVPVERGELYDLLEQAVANRVSEGLPLGVPEEIETALDEPLEDLSELLADEEFPLEFDAVVPSVFPPCMRALLERARSGESLPPNSRYALVGFLAATGMDADGIVDLAGGGLDRETVEYQVAHLRDDRSLEYTPPSCATMDAYDDCVNRDDRCDTVEHPMSYYGDALEAHGESQRRASSD